MSSSTTRPGPAPSSDDLPRRLSGALAPCLRAFARGGCLAGLAAGLTWAGSAGGTAPGSAGAGARGSAGGGQIAQAIASGRYLLGLQGAARVLARDPDDLETRSQLAVLRSRTGWYSEAISEFGLSWGSAYYEQEGLGPHADALRALGHNGEAADLRLQRLLSTSDEGEELTALLGASDDLREGADPWGALDLAERAVALRPRSGVAWAAMAQARLEAGDPDQAQLELWFSEHYGGSSLRGPLVAARLALLDGDPFEAERLLLAAAGPRVSSWQLAILLAEAWRAQGVPDEGLRLLEMPHWATQQERPELLAAEMLLRLDLGQASQARAICARLARTYPDNLSLRAAVAEVEGGIGRPCRGP